MTAPDLDALDALLAASRRMPMSPQDMSAYVATVKLQQYLAEHLPSLLARLRAAEADAATATQELKNIRDTDTASWDVSVRDQFQQWAQSRATRTLAAIDTARANVKMGDEI